MVPFAVGLADSFHFRGQKARQLALFLGEGQAHEGPRGIFAALVFRRVLVLEGGAHRAPQAAIEAVADQIAKGLSEMDGMSGEQLLKSRREKFLGMGRNL